MTITKCTANIRIKCRWDCPLRDREFSYLLDQWVLTERELPSLNWERGGVIDNRAQERRTLEKCEITRLFDYPDQMQSFVANGRMSRWLCKDLRMGYYLWRETSSGITLKQAKRRYMRHKNYIIKSN